ncbi:hypothetical protein MASR2M78_05660 [Treponema sp.]
MAASARAGWPSTVSPSLRPTGAGLFTQGCGNPFYRFWEGLAHLCHTLKDF